MGYTTVFEGIVTIHGLQVAQVLYLNTFSNTRRMKRNVKLLSGILDPIREAVGLPLGEDGEFFVGGDDCCVDSIIDRNSPPSTQPGLWCDWNIQADGEGLTWNGSEKFYNYTEWLVYIIENFIKRWGLIANGQITWQGEDSSDFGIISVVNNVVVATPNIR